MRQKLTLTAATLMVLFNCLFPGGSLFAQQKTIIGKVASFDGTGLRGVVVQEKGTSNSVVTDANGTYAIRISGTGAVLVFTYVGFAAQEAQTGNDPSLNVVMQPNNKELNEVVVTALGIKKEARKVGYAIQEIKGDALAKAREPDVFNSLEGKVAGLTIGANPEFFARPMIVNRGTRDMLIVVDGVPINSDTWNINADDIETVSVLKGPNAAALYGFRGQNGAIIITMKKGSKEAKGWQIAFNSTNMIETSNTVLPQVQTEYGRGTAMQYSFGDGLDDHTQRLPTWGPRMEGQPVKQYNSPYDAATGTRTATPYNSIGKDNYQHFLATGALSSENVSLSSSGRNNDIRISYSHVYQKGTQPNTRINMDVLNLNADYDISERLKVSSAINLNVQYTPNIPDADYGPNSYVYMFNVYGNAAFDVRDLKNYYKSPMGVPGLRQYTENYGRSNNPYFMANQWTRGHYKTDVYGYIKADYTITKGLVATARTQFTGYSVERNEKVPAGTVLNQYLPWYYWGWYGDYREDRRSLLENNSDFLLSYNKKFGDNWTLYAGLGASERSFRYSSFYGTTVDLAIPGVYSLSNSQTPSLAYNWGSNMQVYSGYYSFDLGYKNYFTLSSTGRLDNLSTLPKQNNTFYYPSVSLSTNLVDYLSLPTSISYFKLRGSYADVRGALTTALAPSAYSLATGSSLGNLLGYGFEYNTSYDGPTYANQDAYAISTYYNNQPAVTYPTVIADPKLKSFDVKSTEVGVDYRMFQSRLGLDVTYFRTVNGPQIYPLTVSSSTGYQSGNQNAITSLKTGWEITLTAEPVRTRNFSWQTTVNYSTYKETLKEIYAGLTEIPLANHNYKIGERLDDWYGTAFVRDGSDNIVWSGGGPLLATGNLDQKYKYLGHLNPDFVLGWNNRFTYKNISLSFQFDGRFGGIVYDDLWYHAMNGGTAIESDQGAIAAGRLGDWEAAKGNGGVIPASYKGTFVGQGVVISSGTPTYAGGQITNLKSISFTGNSTPIIMQSYLSSALGSNVDEYYTMSRTFVKLREVQLSYSLPTKALGKSVIKSASIALVGRNLLYFAHRKDFDIDQYASGFNAADRSYSGTSNDVTLSSPTFRRFGFNLNMTF